MPPRQTDCFMATTDMVNVLVYHKVIDFGPDLKNIKVDDDMAVPQVVWSIQRKYSIYVMCW